MSVYVGLVPNKTIYVRGDDESLWADTESLSKRSGRSVSELIAEGLRLLHAKHTAPVRRPLPAAQLAHAASPLPEPVPNPFAARD